MREFGVADYVVEDEILVFHSIKGASRVLEVGGFHGVLGVEGGLTLLVEDKLSVLHVVFDHVTGLVFTKFGEYHFLVLQVEWGDFELTPLFVVHSCGFDDFDLFFGQQHAQDSVEQGVLLRLRANLVQQFLFLVVMLLVQILQLTFKLLHLDLVLLVQLPKFLKLFFRVKVLRRLYILLLLSLVFGFVFVFLFHHLFPDLMHLVEELLLHLDLPCLHLLTLE